MRRAAPFILAMAAVFFPAACAPVEEVAEEGGEAAPAEGALGVPLTEPDETDAPTRIAAQPLDVASVAGLFDVRGLGDSGWANTHERAPRAAELGAALDRFDATGKGYRGHATYINWETVTGSSCAAFANAYSPGRSYAFLSRAENLTQAFDRGISLVGLSNNHSRDCADPDGEGLTAKARTALDRSGVAFHGVGPDAATKTRASVVVVRAGGRDVRLAFGSIYFGSARSCALSVCASDRAALFASLRDADADLRILATHSMDAGTQEEAVRAGIDFVTQFGGDAVFGSGPHVWKGVRVERKGNGKRGVVFESVGNFLHPSLAAQAKNFIGRALYDARTLELAQVQLLPVANAGADVKWSSADAAQVPANLRWSPSPARGVYANVKR